MPFLFSADKGVRWLVSECVHIFSGFTIEIEANQKPDLENGKIGAET